jgi:hypothetical protein
MAGDDVIARDVSAFARAVGSETGSRCVALKPGESPDA